MNLNLYNPPEQWTEEKINEISDEDNRYEFKCGLILNKPQTEFEEDIAKEICALANSFGGTLFLGVKDKTKEIDGVPKIKKGRQSIKAWIEDIIPNLLEFRLPNFRVLEVLLSAKTIAKIGTDKTVISIDIYDSDLAPHRSLKNEKYYYRQGSQSVLAPHHYLAFLWGRTSPNMSNVVNTWFKLYLNHCIKILEKTAKNFEENDFDTFDDNIGQTPLSKRNVVFFKRESWSQLNSTLTAKQFLKFFPVSNSKISEFDRMMDNFFFHFKKLERIIEDSPEFEQAIRNYYNQTLISRDFSDNNQFNEKSFIEIIGLCAGEIFDINASGLSNYSGEIKQNLIMMTAYNLLNLDSSFQHYSSKFFNFCKDNIANQFNESKVELETVLKQIAEIRNEIAQKTDLLAKEFDELRNALALKYNATFE